MYFTAGTWWRNDEDFIFLLWDTRNSSSPSLERKSLIGDVTASDTGSRCFFSITFSSVVEMLLFTPSWRIKKQNNRLWTRQDRYHILADEVWTSLKYQPKLLPNKQTFTCWNITTDLLKYNNRNRRKICSKSTMIIS